MRALSKKDLELVDAVKAYAKSFKPKRFRGEHCSSVYAGVRTKGGSVFIGPNVYHPYSAPASICAEYSALALAYAAGHRDIGTIVAYHYQNPRHQCFFSPCGQCREFISLFGNPWVIVPKGKSLRKVRLKELLPASTS